MTCDADLLRTLVEQSQDPGPETDAIARHLETCPKCQSVLALLGGDETWQEEASRWLTILEDGGPVDDAPCQLPVDTSFLDPPSHPEMLGRIGRYDIEGLVGRGGMGVVFRGYDRELNRTVAVKVLAPEWAASDAARKRFAREAQSAASVTHENVVPIFNVESSGPLPFLVMRFIPGMTLQRWIGVRGVPDVATILRIAIQIADGLAAAHGRGIIHRDIKPGNVLVGENVDRVWITDFGLARAADSVTLTQTGVIAGTPHYMSPEQARGAPIDQRSDLYSLGCVFFFLCTGRPPLHADNTLAVLHRIVTEEAPSLTRFRGDLPPALVTLVRRLLRRSPDQRPHDCESAIRMLREAQEEQARGKVASPGRKHRKPASVIAVLSVVAVAAVTMSLVWPSRMKALPDSASETSNPFLGEVTRDPVSPQISQASQEIDHAVSVDAAEIAGQLAGFEQQLSRMEVDRIRPISSTVFDFDDHRWNHVVGEIDAELRRIGAQTAMDTSLPLSSNR